MRGPLKEQQDCMETISIPSTFINRTRSEVKALKASKTALRDDRLDRPIAGELGVAIARLRARKRRMHTSRTG